MKSIKFACVLCFGSMMLATVGCGKSKALLSAEEYEKEACACKDVACVTEATKKFGERSKDAASMSSSEAEAVSKASTNAAACVTKITMASVPAMPGMPKK